MVVVAAEVEGGLGRPAAVGSGHGDDLVEAEGEAANRDRLARHHAGGVVGAGSGAGHAGQEDGHAEVGDEGAGCR